MVGNKSVEDILMKVSLSLPLAPTPSAQVEDILMKVSLSLPLAPKSRTS